MHTAAPYTGAMRGLAGLALCALCPAPAAAQEPPRVVPVYLVPRDSGFPLEGVRYHAKALADVRRWYGRVLGGRTFVHEPLVVQVSRHTFAELAADDFQAWWPLLQREFARRAVPHAQRIRPPLELVVQHYWQKR